MHRRPSICSRGRGKSQLPAELHADFERVLLASRQIEQGSDDPAKETLQGIGLKSPFLEWKLFLRGLQAYYLNDDVRAVENWQRLNPDRVPARLAAAEALLLAGRPDAALKMAREALEFFDATELLRNQASQILDPRGLPHPLASRRQK